MSAHTRKAQRLQLSAHTSKSLKQKGGADGMTYGNQKILHRALGKDPLQIGTGRRGYLGFLYNVKLVICDAERLGDLPVGTRNAGK